jgi:sugar phosphate isomerase/epimerase
MPNQLAVSSYSLRQLLGPVRLLVRGDDGARRDVTWGDEPATLSLLDLPGQVRERLGLDAIEICQFHLPARTPAYLRDLRRALDDAGIALVNVPIDVGNISDANADHRAEDLAQIEGWMRAAAELGSANVRVNASGPMSHDALAPIETTIESYRRLAATAKSLGLGLLIENHGGITADPEVIVRLVESVEGLRTLVDVYNFEPLLGAAMARFRGESVPDPDPEPVYAQIARIAPYAGMVHAKTHEFDAEGRPIGLDVARALRVVKDAGYAGPVSIEYEGSTGDPWENTLRTKRIVESVFA